MSEPNVVTLHIRYRLFFRHMRRLILGVLCISFALGIAGMVELLRHSNHPTPAAHTSVASELLLLLAPLLTVSYAVWVSRRSGYYARPGELGTVGVLGRLTRFRQPVVRFHRFTITNWRWIRFIGMGRVVTVPVIVALNEAGQRSLTLTAAIYPQADIDRFLATSGLPVDGDWYDHVARRSLDKRWPISRDIRRQGWIAAGLTLPAVLLMMGGIVGALLTR